MNFLENAPNAVVIPVHGGRDFTARCLESLRSCDAVPLMVVVVDDGSPDDTSSFLAANHPDVHVVPGDGELWWSGAVNVGCAFAVEKGARTLILLNNDNVEVSRNLIRELVRVVDERGGVVGATTLAETREGRREIIAEGGALDWRGRGTVLRRAGEPYVEEDRLTPCEWLPGMALAFDSELFRRLGGIDAATFPQSRGDADFTIRARILGYPCDVSAACWVVNDRRQGPLAFYHRLGVRDLLRGLVTRNSAYQVRTTVAFHLRHSPRRWVVPGLLAFYARYLYAWLKTQRMPRTHDIRFEAQ